MADILIRQATASDQAAIAELIGGVYAEYGDELCLDDAEKDLTEIPEYYHDRDGDFVVMCDRDEIIGCHAVLPISGKSGTCTFRRLYLTHSRRGGGYGKLLMQWAVDWARDKASSESNSGLIQDSHMHMVSLSPSVSMRRVTSGTWKIALSHIRNTSSS